MGAAMNQPSSPRIRERETISDREAADLLGFPLRSLRAVIDREVVAPLGMDPSLVRVPGDDGGPVALDVATTRSSALVLASAGLRSRLSVLVSTSPDAAR